MYLSFAVRESDMRLGGSHPRLGLAQRTLVPSSTPSAISTLSNVLRSTHSHRGEQIARELGCAVDFRSIRRSLRFHSFPVFSQNTRWFDGKPHG